MPDSHAPLGEGIVRIKIQKVSVLFWCSYINGGKKRDGQTTFRHGDIGFAVLHRDQGKIAESVFRDDLADILAYFLTWNAAPMVLGCIVMLTITFSVINLIVDLLYAYIDPRIKAQYKKK